MLDRETKKLYLAHKNMLARCYDPSNASYKHYGARGIRVCDEWLWSRDSFVNWALTNGHDMHLSLDRIDTDGDYHPQNCRWATTREQLLNQRRNHVITHKNTTQPLAVWAQQLGINISTLSHRVTRYKMPLEKALTPTSLRKGLKCGTRHMYEKGCRCSDCRRAHADRQRVMRLRRKQRASETSASIER